MRVSRSRLRPERTDRRSKSGLTDEQLIGGTILSIGAAWVFAALYLRRQQAKAKEAERGEASEGAGST